MTITRQQVTVYYAPTAGRRFLTKRAAINKEARAIILKHFPSEARHDCSEEVCGWCRAPGWSLEEAQPERFRRYYRLLSDALKRAIK